MHTMPGTVLEGLPEMRSATTALQIKRFGSSDSSLNYDQYLLASSPPGIGYHLFQMQSGQKQIASYGQLASDYNFRDGFTRNSSDIQSFKSSLKPTSTRHTIHDDLQPSIVASEAKELKVVKNGCILSNGATHANKTVEKRTDGTAETLKNGRVRKVSFADEYGLRLTEIKTFSETPDMLPTIRTKTMLCYSNDVLQDHLPSLAKMADVNPALVPDFPMPISNYTAFKEKLERDFVSLESIHVATNDSLVGTVEVMNLAYDKTVFVRCTYDEWKTHFDIPAKYKPASSFHLSSNHPFDWFTFTITVSSKCFAQRKAEFAVCFQCEGQEYWDSNDGTNYKLVTPDWRKEDEDKDRKVLENAVGWREYIDWKDRTRSWPYW